MKLPKNGENYLGLPKFSLTNSLLCRKIIFISWRIGRNIARNYLAPRRGGHEEFTPELLHYYYLRHHVCYFGHHRLRQHPLLTFGCLIFSLSPAQEGQSIKLSLFFSTIRRVKSYQQFF